MSESPTAPPETHGSARRVSIQTGFSDAGRFVGQVPASIAIERLQGLVDEASIKPVYRVPTRPTRACTSTSGARTACRPS